MCFQVSGSGELHIEHVMLGYKAGPKNNCLCTSIIHVLIISKFEDACYLRVCNIMVALEGIGSFIIYGCIAGPFTNVEKMAGNVFKGVLFLTFLEVWLKMTYGTFI